MFFNRKESSTTIHKKNLSFSFIYIHDKTVLFGFCPGILNNYVNIWSQSFNETWNVVVVLFYSLRLIQNWLAWISNAQYIGPLNWGLGYLPFLAKGVFILGTKTKIALNFCSNKKVNERKTPRLLNRLPFTNICWIFIFFRSKFATKKKGIYRVLIKHLIHCCSWALV